jgi:GNAT superfamily N-acetyltransferase
MRDGELRIQRATLGDLEGLLRIADARRQTYAEYQSRLWRPAPDAVDRQRSYVTSLLDDEETLVLAAIGDDAGLRGFAIGRLVPAPPVYDPGGASCVVDDFAVADPGEWPTIGPLLLDALRDWAASRGAAQMIVVTAHLDQPKRAVLRSRDLTLASEWWVGPVG